jgi:hypothetical protein
MKKVLIFFFFCHSFLKAGGSVDRLLELMCDNYHAVAQMINVMAEWLMLAGEFCCCFFLVPKQKSRTIIFVFFFFFKHFCYRIGI